jgi:hypothetical protein
LADGRDDHSLVLRMRCSQTCTIRGKETPIGDTDSGHADTFHFSFTTKDGTLSGRVSVAMEGRPDTRSREEKMRAARIKVEHLAHASSGNEQPICLLSYRIR